MQADKENGRKRQLPPEYIDYESKFIERLTQLRQLQRVSCREMSLALGQSEGYINKIENHKALPSMQIFFYICSYLGVTPEEFFAFLPEQSKTQNFCDRFARLPEEKQDHILLLLEDME
ncbi:MAG: helix-turn-helix transcriptional regulator [Lachnospiraceae bacterium]|nr:helix-turn-helix transcriptional regulator [Lachnospiraceae bacterium]